MALWAAPARILAVMYRAVLVSFALALLSIIALPSAAFAQTKHLDAAVRHAMLSERFHTVVRVSEIPPAVMAAASEARGPNSAQYGFEMAEPGAPFQSTDVIVTPTLPGRRLVAAFASDNSWIVHYEAGGVAHTYHLAVFAVRGNHAQFVWHALVRRKLTGIDDLRKLLREGSAATLDDSYTRFY